MTRDERVRASVTRQILSKDLPPPSHPARKSKGRYRSPCLCCGTVMFQGSGGGNICSACRTAGCTFRTPDALCPQRMTTTLSQISTTFPLAGALDYHGGFGYSTEREDDEGWPDQVILECMQLRPPDD